MTIKTTLCLVTAASMLLVVGCKKPDATPTAGTEQAPPPAPPPATAPAPAPAAGEVTTYPNQTPLGGTVELLQGFIVHQAADEASPILTHLGPGQLVDLKATYSNWVMLMWPSGVGQLSPGWVELHGGVSDSRVKIHVPLMDAGVAPTPTVPPKPTATTPTRAPITIPPRKTH